MIETDIYNRLSGYAGLTALTDIYPGEVPQSVTPPYVNFYKIAAPREHAMGSDPGLVHSVYRFNIFHSVFESMAAISVQLNAALSRYSGTDTITIQDTFLDNELDLYDEKEEVHHRITEFTIHHTE